MTAQWQCGTCPLPPPNPSSFTFLSQYSLCMSALEVSCGCDLSQIWKYCRLANHKFVFISAHAARTLPVFQLQEP
jgi:hypothetical protein